MSLRLFQVHVHHVFVVLEDSQRPSDITITAVLCLPPYFQSILRLTASSHLSEARQCIHICWLVPLFIMHVALKYVLLMQWRVSSKATSTICGPNTHIFKICLHLFFLSANTVSTRIEENRQFLFFLNKRDTEGSNHRVGGQIDLRQQQQH